MIEPKHILLSLLIKKSLMNFDTKIQVFNRANRRRQICTGKNTYLDFVSNEWSKKDICELYLYWLRNSQRIFFTKEQKQNVSDVT